MKKETTLPIKWIAARLQMGTSKSLKPMRLHWRHAQENASGSARCAQLQFPPPVRPFFLAAACAEAGQFPQAVEAAGRALALAVAQKNPQVEGIRARLQLYQDRSPYYQPLPTGGGALGP